MRVMEPVRTSGALLKTKRVFIVDDQEDTRDLYAEVLRIEGFVVDTAPDAEDALGKIEETPPDVVVADYMLSNINGFEFCRMLKANVKTDAIPVIIVTGFDGPAWEEEAKRAGASQFLNKPLLPNDLVSAIRTLVSKPLKGDAGASA